MAVGAHGGKLIDGNEATERSAQEAAGGVGAVEVLGLAIEVGGETERGRADELEVNMVFAVKVYLTKGAPVRCSVCSEVHSTTSRRLVRGQLMRQLLQELWRRRVS